APDDPDSNYRLARALWLDRIAVEPAQIHRMIGEGRNPDAAAAAYAEELRAYFGGLPRFDFAMIGVGPDGHICSLFPDHWALRDSRLAVAIHDSPKPPPTRLTLTLSALTGAAVLYVAAFGDSKAAVIADAVRNSQSQLPVALAARSARQSVFLLDSGAAKLL
ncbi:MAG TPA: 6-phosphogluconolactonase, partial [Candidatus Acidoferrales bacterium]|nr:6-phosphogluconolactonase [Candidatus Acidoferrales bacterium]